MLLACMHDTQENVSDCGVQILITVLHLNWKRNLNGRPLAGGDEKVRAKQTQIQIPIAVRLIVTRIVVVGQLRVHDSDDEYSKSHGSSESSDEEGFNLHATGGQGWANDPAIPEREGFPGKQTQ
jgi:hypothetical protein